MNNRPTFSSWPRPLRITPLTSMEVAEHIIELRKIGYTNEQIKPMIKMFVNAFATEPDIMMLVWNCWNQHNRHNPNEKL